MIGRRTGDALSHFVALGVPVLIADRLLQGGSWLQAIVLGIAAGVAAGVLDAVGRATAPQAWTPPLRVSQILALGVGLTLVWDVAGRGFGAETALGCLAVGALLRWLGNLPFPPGRRFRPHSSRAVVVGTGVVAQALVGRLAQRDVRVLGFIDDEPGDLPPDAPPVLGGFDDLERLIASTRPDSVVFAFSRMADRDVIAAMRICRSLGVHVAVVSRMFQQLDRRVRLRRLDGLPVLSVEPNVMQRWLPTASRVLDAAVAAVTLVLTLPISLLVAAAIVIESRGGIFYRAQRVGFRGESLSMLKFRKMRSDAVGPRITVAGDDRFTRVGRLLARTKLDELPQLWNVLLGQMRLVGPRPEDPYYVELYRDAYEHILQVKPGITGLSQIQYRDEANLLLGEDFERRYRDELLPSKVAIDRYYAERRSLGLDLRIIAWTVVALVREAQVCRDPLTDHLSFARGSAEADVSALGEGQALR